MQECKKELDKARYACFARPEHSSQTPAPEKGSRRHSWRNFFSSNGIPTTIPEVPPAVFESLPVFVGRDNEEPRIGSFSVRPQYSRCLDWTKPRKFQDGEWLDEAGARETLSILAHSLGFEFAKRLAYRIG